MEIALATLEGTVAGEKNAEIAALLLLEGLLAQFDACGTDLTKLAALVSAVKAHRGALAEAVVANTARTYPAPEAPAAAA